MPKRIEYAKDDIPQRVYIYKIECIPNHKCYVGRTTNLPNRLWNHKKSLIANRHVCADLQNDYIKYGKENFTFSILESGDYEVWNSELWWMIVLKTFDERYGYNNKDAHFRKKGRPEIDRLWELREMIMKGISYGKKH